MNLDHMTQLLWHDSLHITSEFLKIGICRMMRIKARVRRKLPWLLPVNQHRPHPGSLYQTVLMRL